jgi:FkbM family methyltransferase
MNFARRAHQLYRAGGTESVIRHGKRKILSYFDPFYQRLKPPYRFYSVFPPPSAEFDMSLARLGEWNFIDDIRSERELFQRILSIVNSDDVFYDIGANVGIYSCLVGNQIESGYVISFEPTPEAFTMLELNVQRNGINAELFNVALSNSSGTTQMSVRGQTGHQFSNEGTGTIEIETTQADELIKKHNLRPPDICKIDIEGAEYLALDGFREILAESECHHVFCEIHTGKIEAIGGSAKDVEHLLQELDFDLEYLGDRRENYFVEATRVSQTD